MKWQTASALFSTRSRDTWQRASVAGLGGLLALRLMACATTDDNGAGALPVVQGSGGAIPNPAVCGNGFIETGETCDGPATPTCGAATMGAKPLGSVRCNACQMDLSGCESSASGGMASTGTGGSATGTGASAGMEMGGSGGTQIVPPPGSGGAGGTLGSGGTIATGGQPPGSGGARGGAAGASGNSGILGDVDALRQTCVDTINMYRATKNLAPLKRASASVEMCSDNGAKQDGTAMVAHGSAGKCPGMGAQDTCPGWPPGQYGGPAGALKSCLMSMWAEGEPTEGRTACINAYFAGNIACFEAHGHYLNMSDPANGTVSCGFYVMPNGSLWMNQDLGR